MKKVGGVALLAIVSLGISGCGKEPPPSADPGSVPFLGKWEGEERGSKIQFEFGKSEMAVVEQGRRHARGVVYYRSVGTDEAAYGAALTDEQGRKQGAFVVRMEGENKIKVHEGGEEKARYVLTRVE